MGNIGFETRVQWRDEFGRFAQALDVGAQRSQEEGSQVGAILAAALAPKRSGLMAGTIRSTGHGFAVGTAYALAQEKGAAPHLIGATFGSTLVNEAEGFGPVMGPITHPGNPATHFMKNALRMVNQRLMGIIRGNMP